MDMDFDARWNEENNDGNGWAVRVCCGADGSTTNEETDTDINELEEDLSRQTGREWRLAERSWTDNQVAVYHCEQDGTYIAVSDCYGPWACGPWTD